MDLATAIEAAIRRMGITRAEYAGRVGLSHEGLRKIMLEGRANGSTLARLQRDGGVRITKKLIASMDSGL